MPTRLLPIPMGSGPTPGEYYTAAEIDAMLLEYAQLATTALVNYYLKSETYTKAEIEALVGQITSFDVVATLPVSDIKTNVIYLLGPIGTGADRYEEYIYSNSTWTKIGETSIDLSNYVTVTQLNTALGFYTTTQQLNTLLQGKQDTLTAGDRISISTQNVISADSQVISLTQAEYDALGTQVDPDVVYVITDATPVTLATVATTGSYNDLTDKPALSTVATSGSYADLTGTPTLATVATSGSYNDLTNTPTIPAVGTGVVTLTQGGATIGTFGLNDSSDKTIDIPAGGGVGGNAWYGSQYQFDTLGTYDVDTDYYISDKIPYSEISGTPNLSVYETKAASQAADQALGAKIAVKENSIVFLGTAGLPSIGTPLEGITYAIEGETLPLTFTLADQSTATYNFVID